MELKKASVLFTSVVLIVMSGLMSCQKDIDMTIPDPNQNIGPDTSWYAAVTESMSVYELKQDIEDDYDYDTVSIMNGAILSFTTNSDLHFSITPGSIVNSNGLAHNGNMIVKSKLIRNMGESALMLKQNLNSNGSLLSSGGTFFTSFYDMNQQGLHIASNQNISVSYHSVNSFPGMNLFFENPAGIIFSNWQQSLDSLQNYLSVSGDYHYVHVNRTGWVNCSTENFSGNQSSRIMLQLPSNYTNANTIVFLSFDDLKSVINFDADVNGRNFKTGWIPAGRQATITVISKQGGYYYLKQHSISTAGTTGSYQTISMTPVITTLNNMKTVLRAL